MDLMDAIIIKSPSWSVWKQSQIPTKQCPKVHRHSSQNVINLKLVWGVSGQIYIHTLNLTEVDFMKIYELSVENVSYVGKLSISRATILFLIINRGYQSKWRFCWYILAHVMSHKREFSIWEISSVLWRTIRSVQRVNLYHITLLKFRNTDYKHRFLGLLVRLSTMSSTTISSYSTPS